jgi:hypothetical protein
MKTLSSVLSVVLLVAGLLAAIGVKDADAVVIDFDSFVDGTVITTQIPEFDVVADPGGSLWILSNLTFSSTPPNSLGSDRFNFALNFHNAVNGLEFDVSAEDAAFTVDVMHVGGTTTVSVPFDGDNSNINHIDLSGFSDITSIYFDLGITNGHIDEITIDTIEFTVSSVSAPWGATLGGALIGIGLFGRRMKEPSETGKGRPTRFSPA